MEKLESVNIDNIYNRICELIEKANIAIKVNKEITILYWYIGKDIEENVLKYENQNMESLL